MDDIQLTSNVVHHHDFNQTTQMIYPSNAEELKFRINWILSNQRVESNIVLMFAAILLAIGFFIGKSINSNYTMIYDFASAFTWATMLSVYATIKFLSIVWIVPKTVCTMNGIFGVWMWNYIFLSFVVFDTTAIAPAEILLLLPILIEVWAMIDIPRIKKDCKNEY